VEDKGKGVVCGEVEISVFEMNTVNNQLWLHILDTLEMHVPYAAQIARIINTPYVSDLTPWCDGRTPYLEEFRDDERSNHKDKKRVHDFLKYGKHNAQCTLNSCDSIHRRQWALNSTLHPLPQNNETLKHGDDKCEKCGGDEGKDGGLFMGETILHITIVQSNDESCKWRLDRGLNLDDCALGVFFQDYQVSKFDSDTKMLFPFGLTSWAENQKVIYGSYP